MDARIHPRELKFLLNQMAERIMVIAGVDMAVTNANLMQIRRGSIRKGPRVGNHSSESTSRKDDLQASLDDESSSLSESGVSLLQVKVKKKMPLYQVTL